MPTSVYILTYANNKTAHFHQYYSILKHFKFIIDKGGLSAKFWQKKGVCFLQSKEHLLTMDVISA